MSQKRTFRGEFRLPPTRELTQILEYALAYAAQQSGVLLHEFFVISNHDHEVFTDPEARAPEFWQIFHALAARAINAHFDEGDSLWSTLPVNSQVLQSPSVVWDKLLYTLNQSVDAAITHYPGQWEGVTSWKLEYGVPKVVKRPAVFFDSRMPETIELMIHRPANVRPDLDDVELRAAVRAAAQHQAGDIRRAIQSQGRGFIGMERCKKLPRNYGTTTKMRPGGWASGFAPAISAPDPETRVRAITELQTFRADHRESMHAYRAGQHDVVFPAGTYKMRVQFGVRCHPP